MSNVAFVFPGQGSQSQGMLSALDSEYPLIIELFNQVSERLGYDVWDMVQHNTDEKLNQTEYTQVAMLAADVAVYKTFQQLSTVSPVMMAGHSLGEYAALVCADAISLSDAAFLVAKRGYLMQKTIPLGKGAMAAIIGLSDEQVELLCQQASRGDEVVTPANYNAIGQVVIAGHTDAVTKVIKTAEAKGARLAKLIPVSVPCHCPLLSQAGELFAEYLAKTDFATPTVPVISNVDAAPYQSPKQIRTLLKEQLYRPVRWVETIQLMKQQGIDTIIECGPGNVLSGLVKRIDKTLLPISINDPATLNKALNQFKTAI